MLKARSSVNPNLLLLSTLIELMFISLPLLVNLVSKGTMVMRDIRTQCEFDVPLSPLDFHLPVQFRS